MFNNKVYHQIDALSGSVATLRAEGVKYNEIAEVESRAGTSLAQVISVVEMFTIAKQLGNAQASIAPLVVAGVFYYLFNWLVASGMERIEKKLSYYR